MVDPPDQEFWAVVVRCPAQPDIAAALLQKIDTAAIAPLRALSELDEREAAYLAELGNRALRAALPFIAQSQPRAHIHPKLEGG